MATERLNHEDVGRIVRAEIARRLKGDVVQPARLDNETLEALGMGSLDVMELADSLETILRVDPFDRALSLNDVRTVGDLCRAYQAALGADAQGNGHDDPLIASRARAEARRRTS